MEIMEIREVEIREVTEDRTVSGIAVPYNQTTSVNGMKERVEKGAFGTPENVTLFYGHDHRTGGLPIGKVVEARDTDEGLVIKAQISKTAKGDEVYTLLREGVLNKFSIGFQPTKSRREGDVVVREKGDLKEVSIVAIPAYANAAVSEVRDADNLNTKENEVMTETVNNAPEVAEIREAVSDLERKFAVLSEQGNTETAGTSQFRSFGELVKGLAENDEAARMEVRAYTGGTFADNDNATRPGWVNAQLKLIEEKRPVLNLFSKGALPSSGMSVEYPQVTAVTGSAGIQANEGDDLPYVEVTVGSASANIVTYGAYTALSRQEIERTEVGMLDISLRNLRNEYAKRTEAAVRSAFVGAAGVQTGTLAADTAAGWIDTVFDAAALIEDNAKGAAAEFVLVSRDVFKRIGHMVDSTGRPLFVINGDGVNSLGNVSLRGVRGNIAGFPIVVGSQLPNNSLYVASAEAVTVFEDPFKSLQDENIINLTKDFSVYGYMAVALTNPLAVVKVDADLVA